MSLDELGTMAGLDWFIITRDPEPHIDKNWLNRLSRYVAGVFGVVFRDGGIDAVKVVLNHVDFFRTAPARFSKLQEIGLTASQVLLTNSLYGHASAS